ncbi:2098_t:CDS:2, partial [Gigaspora rosea]
PLLLPVTNDLDLPLVGCASHRLNLAVNDLISSSSILVNQIRAIVIMMQTYKNRGKLAKVTSLMPILDNATRWMSQLNLNEVDSFINQLKYFSEATNDLQNESMNLDDVRAYFDLLIEEFLRKQEAALTFTEREKLQEFIVEQKIQPTVEGSMTMKERVAKKRKLEESKYMDMNLIPPTSNA